MKKTFYQLGAPAFLLYALMLVFIALGIFLLCTREDVYIHYIVDIFICLYFPVVCTYTLIAFGYNRIVFYEDRIVVTGNLGKKTWRTQYSDCIHYTDIVDVTIIVACGKNSKKRNLKDRSVSNIRPTPFFEFLLKNGKTKWVCIYSFGIRQRKKMLQLINERSGLSLDYARLKETSEKR